METSRTETISGAVRLLFEGGTVAGMSDGQLLDRFLDARGGVEAAEVAFAALVERHGPMVLRACRARLGSEHDAQDAFQATFLILARKAGSIRKQESAASWLHGVARRVASCSRRAATLRRAKERKAAGGRLDLVVDPEPSDLVPAVREEVGDLPETERAPLMLCLLDGLTHEQAAERLGCPVGTVKTRVRRAKDRLRVALTRRGLAPSLGAIATALSAREASAMPASLARATARLALGMNQPGSVAVASTVSALVELGSRSLIMARLKLAALVLTSVGVLAGGATVAARYTPTPQGQAIPKPAEPGPDANDAVAPKPAVEGDEVEAAELDRLDRVEATQIDLELLQQEVQALKNNMTTSMQSLLGAKSYMESLMAPTNSGGFGNGGFREKPKGEALEAAKKQQLEYIDYAQKQIGEARAAYLEKNRELTRVRRKLTGLMTSNPRAAARPVASPASKPAADLEKRLSDVEQKLDQVLKAPENRPGGGHGAPGGK